MGGQHDIHGFIDIVPFGVMVEFFSHHGDAAHPGESGVKVGKDKPLGNRLPPFGFLPAAQFAKRGLFIGIG